MKYTAILVTIISSLISGIVGVIISAAYYRHHEKQRTKIETFKRFFSNRYDLKGDEFTRAINEIFVVFHGSEEVRSTLREYHQLVTERRSSEDALLKLNKVMCKDVKISFDKFNDSFFLKPFNTRPSSMAQHSASGDIREAPRPHR